MENEVFLPSYCIGIATLLTAIPYLFLNSSLHIPTPESKLVWGLIYGAVVMLAIGGMGIALIVRSGRVSASTLLRVGILYFYVGAIASQVIQLGADALQIANTSSTYNILLPWIVIFSFSIPTTARIAYPAVIVIATMAPITYAVFLRMGLVEGLNAMGWIMRFAPVYITALAAAFLSTRYYRKYCSPESMQQMGNYKLTELIGKGAMGEVWRAKHRMLSRYSAIKFIHPRVFHGSTASTPTSRNIVTRFEREAKATAALRSPHSVEIYDFGVTQDGRFYYAMELLDGIDLDLLVKRFGPLPASRVIYFLLQICDSLSEAHELGLIHRDIKPKNIFNCQLGRNFDFIKILDFGLVKNMGTGKDAHLTAENLTAGTPAYLSPEAARGSKNVDSRSDLYSLGCVAYWLLTGKPVFEGASAMSTILQHVQDFPIPPSQRTENPVPEDLEFVVLRCLEKDAGKRPQSADELSLMLASCKDAKNWCRCDAGEWWRLHLPSPLALRAQLCTIRQ